MRGERKTFLIKNNFLTRIKIKSASDSYTKHWKLETGEVTCIE